MEGSDSERRMDLADIPYDILGEIFLLCLPDNPLRIRQPDTLQVPILLCRICSAWRNVALSTPRLWKYLFYTIGTHAFFPATVFTKRDFEFLDWWCGRLRTIPLSLRLASARPFKFFPDMSPNSKEFLLNLIKSACYLNLDVWCTKALIDLERHESVTYANLDALVLTDVGHWDRWSATYMDNLKSRIPGMVQSAFPISSNTMTIQRLIMDPRWITEKDVQQPSIDWSRLTHFYACIITTPRVWDSLIRECVRMVSGNFLFDFRTPRSRIEIQDSTKHMEKTLPQLRELVLGGREGYELASTLQNLLLPNLLTLSIGNPNLSVERINQMLSSTPGLQELHLSPNELFLHEGAFVVGDTSSDCLPLHHIVPDLRSIHFGGHIGNTPDIYTHPDTAMQALRGPWLSLGNEGSSVTQLIFSSENRLNRQPLGNLIEDMKKVVPSSVQLVIRPWKTGSIWGMQTIHKLQFADIDINQPLFRHEAH